MLQPRIAGVRPTLESLTSTFTCLSLRQPSAIRHASHAAQGRANGPTDSAGRRLGAKKSNTEHVVAGNIIFKQRGTKWHPGENVGMGKDHTIYALTEGYVRYYRNPRLHPKRRYIGVALAREGKQSVLPTPPNAPSPRRVGMYAVPMKVSDANEAENFLESHLTPGSKPAAPSKGLKASPTAPTDPPIMRAKGYRIANIQIVRNAAANEVKVRPFDKKDRWFAWRVRQRKYRDKKLARATAGAKKKVGKQQAKKGSKK